MGHQQNITRIKAVYNALEEIAKEVVFVGGATVSLYADRPAVETRPTDDIDIMVEVVGYSEYAQIEEKLRSKGFTNDQTSRVICRYQVRGITVDVMPTDQTILGFSNRWYKAAFATSIDILIDGDYSFRILRPDYFIATKLEAFKGRGKNDGRTSSDFEDIIHVLNNRTTIWDEIQQAEEELRHYFTKSFAGLLQNPYLEEWIMANLEYHERNRVEYIVRGLKGITATA
ncbi:hypothetical protein GFS24_16925 [Chitinophaga sp. SYP-B3965]|uniref:hypothetical protein n=1 Tax=Chitinophaga sp. SYP-B3965 TaxID=2663120 RepID=UPI0012998FDB|nr:hypothetical protein [Chitinophaga sp. SYP-B3965]MRG46806.1 hypothetical protein [Chitinophaga sp. SYP-B3965]